MAEYTLLMVETSGIQDFIFGTNNLRVNVGASALVQALTDQWVPEFLPAPSNIIQESRPTPKNVPPPWRVEDQALEQHNLEAEVVYLGGGNALVIFRDQEDAAAFTQKLSEKALKEAPGLRVVIAHVPIDWETQSLAQELKTLRATLAERKLTPIPGLPQPGMGVAANCVFTGEPAAEAWTDPDGQTKLISRSVRARLNCFEYADDILVQLIPKMKTSLFRPVNNFEDFGTLGESSYIAIVHADGNRMGERIEALSEPFIKLQDAESNRNYAQKLRAFSRSAAEAAKTALKKTVLKLIACYDKELGCWQRQYARDSLGQIQCPNGEPKQLPEAIKEQLPKVLKRDNTGSDQQHYPYFLPFRPIVLGGDDVTFVCDGRLGLALAQTYLTFYGEQKLCDGELAVGRAGVAIVNTHFPFSQGYALAENLAKSAKKAGESGLVASLDWHFGVNGVLDTKLKTLRGAHYTVPTDKFKTTPPKDEPMPKLNPGELVTRPLRLGGNDWRQWETFEALVSVFQTGNDWKGRRNKVKALQSALRGGPTQVNSFRANYSLPQLPALGPLKDHADLIQHGWEIKVTQKDGEKEQEARCVYFDALEAIDFYIPLEERRPNHESTVAQTYTSERG